MTDATHCSRCGAPLVTAAAGPVCPACLLKLGFETPTAPGETVLAAPESGATRLAPPPPGGETRLAAPTRAGDAATVLTSPGAGPIPARRSAAPDHIGPYRLVKTLGEGGMGVVYLAEQTEPIRRTVALKLIKLGMDTHEVVARFEAERQALAMMDHPNIASVLDAGATSDGRPYFVMEYAPGAPITEYCDAHKLGTRARLDLFLSVCSAVQHAHQKGIIHRDLKPSNVLVVDQDGKPSPKVIDFGIAKATDQRLSEKAAFTQHGVMIGTPEYMSPEQADPTGVDIDTRTDIYSLGVVLYELLVGGLPFPPTRLREAGYSELLRIIREEEPSKPSARLTGLGAKATDVASRRHTKPPTLAQELRGDLDWITLKALEKDRARRYSSASEFAADLTRHLQYEPVVARPPSVVYRVGKFVRRNRLGVTAAGLFAGAILGGLIVSTLLYLQAETARAESEREAYVANVGAAESDLQAAESMGRGWIGAASGTQEIAHRLFLPNPQQRNWEWHYLFAKLNAASLRLWLPQSIAGTLVDSGPVYRPEPESGPLASFFTIGDSARFWVSPDGREASLLNSGRLLTVDLSTGQLKTADLPWAPGFLAYDPNGRFAAAAFDGGTQVFDRAERRIVATLPGPKPKVAEFSSDGSTLATFGGDKNLRLWRLPEGSLVGQTAVAAGVTCLRVMPAGTLVSYRSRLESYLWRPGHGQSQSRSTNFAAACADFSPDPNYLITTGAQGGLQKWSVAAHSLEGPRFPTLAQVKSVKWHASAGVVAVGQAAGVIQIFDAQTWRPLATLLGHENAGVDGLAFSEDGTRLVSVTDSLEVMTWDVPRIRLAVGVPLKALVGAGAAVSADGNWAAGLRAPGRIDIVNLTTLKVGTGFDLAGAETLATSEDGQFVAGADDKGRVVLWTRGQSAATEIRPADGESVSLTFSPRGDLLAVVGAKSGALMLWNLLAKDRRQLKADRSGRVAFDSAGRRVIAWGSENHAAGAIRPSWVDVWDTATGAPLAAVRPVCLDAAAISHDGQTLVTVHHCGPTLRLWDASTAAPRGQSEVLDLVSGSVAFSPDGSRLVVSNRDDATLRLFDASRLSLVLTLRDKPDRESYGDAWFTRDGTRIVTRGTEIHILDARHPIDPDAFWFVRRLLKEEGLAAQDGAAASVLERIESERSLAPGVRDHALDEIRARGNRDVIGLYLGSWETVRRPGGSSADYKRALAMAEAALQIAPTNADHLALKGMAQYRNGAYGAALATFALAGKLKTPPAAGPIAAFACMAYSHLGRHAEARAELERLRLVMQEPAAAKDDELQSLLAEAEKEVARGG